MKIEKLKAGSTITAEVRDALAEQQLPQEAHFAVRANLQGPLALTALSVDVSLLLDRPVKSTQGWLWVPIGRPLAVDQLLGWSIFSGFSIPEIATYLIVNGRLHFLARKKPLPAGGLWSDRVILRDFHFT